METRPHSSPVPTPLLLCTHHDTFLQLRKPQHSPEGRYRLGLARKVKAHHPLMGEAPAKTLNQCCYALPEHIIPDQELRNTSEQGSSQNHLINTNPENLSSSHQQLRGPGLRT